jgi:hypothetical protein
VLRTLVLLTLSLTVGVRHDFPGETVEPVICFLPFLKGVSALDDVAKASTEDHAHRNKGTDRAALRSTIHYRDSTDSQDPFIEPKEKHQTRHAILYRCSPLNTSGEISCLVGAPAQKMVYKQRNTY